MKFGIITHVIHKIKVGQVYVYEPYVREMNLWAKYVDEIIVLAPVLKNEVDEIETIYHNSNINLVVIPNFDIISFKNLVKALFVIPKICWLIYKVMRQVDHIHLRCPGNIGLLGCVAQICFPKKPKTVKYAGNWDPNAKQPLSYKLQKWILSNTFLTKNMQVLVYGNWPNQSKNIKSFFTASFASSDKTPSIERDYSDNLRFVFVGSLVRGKQPDLAIKIVEALHKQAKNVSLDVYGDGDLYASLQSYIKDCNLNSFITLHGNTSLDLVKEQLQTAHFLILPSKSEGWPKVVAEAMFFGVIPIVTPISCIPYMLDGGNRGILITPEIDRAVLTINEALNSKDLKTMSKLALKWSQQFTLDYLELEIKKLLIRQ